MCEVEICWDSSTSVVGRGISRFIRMRVYPSIGLVFWGRWPKTFWLLLYGRDAGLAGPGFEQGYSGPKTLRITQYAWTFPRANEKK